MPWVMSQRSRVYFSTSGSLEDSLIENFSKSHKSFMTFSLKYRLRIVTERPRLLRTVNYTSSSSDVRMFCRAGVYSNGSRSLLSQILKTSWIYPPTIMRVYFSSSIFDIYWSISGKSISFILPNMLKTHGKLYAAFSRV